MSALAAIRDRVEDLLKDSANANWSANEIDNCIRLAMSRVTDKQPRQVIDTVTLAADGREIDISSLDPAYLEIIQVWDDYDSTDPVQPPRWVAFEVREPDSCHLWTNREPQSGDVERFYYTAAHTIEDLDAAAATTLTASQEAALIIGAAGHAAAARATYLIEAATIDKQTPLRMQILSNTWLATFENLLRPRYTAAAWIHWPDTF